LHFSKNTMYNFSLDKRQVIITAAALAVLTVLIFSAGLLTGMLTRRPAASDQAVKSSETAALMSGTGKTITVDPQTLLTTTPQGLISKVKGEAASEKADLMGKARQPKHRLRRLRVMNRKKMGRQIRKNPNPISAFRWRQSLLF